MAESTSTCATTPFVAFIFFAFPFFFPLGLCCTHVFRQICWRRVGCCSSESYRGYSEAESAETRPHPIMATDHPITFTRYPITHTDRQMWAPWWCCGGEAVQCMVTLQSRVVGRRSANRACGVQAVGRWLCFRWCTPLVQCRHSWGAMLVGAVPAAMMMCGACGDGDAAVVLCSLRLALEQVWKRIGSAPLMETRAGGCVPMQQATKRQPHPASHGRPTRPHFVLTLSVCVTHMFAVAVRHEMTPHPSAAYESILWVTDNHALICRNCWMHRYMYGVWTLCI